MELAAPDRASVCLSRTGAVVEFGTGSAADVGPGGKAILRSLKETSRLGIAITGGAAIWGGGAGDSVRPGTMSCLRGGLGKFGACLAQNASSGTALANRRSSFDCASGCRITGASIVDWGVEGISIPSGMGTPARRG
jgi:hypothetical protein